MEVFIAKNRAELDERASDAGAEALRAELLVNDFINVIIAAAPSQTPMLARLVTLPGIDWKRVRIFHQDEYVGIDRNHPASFARYVDEHVVSKVPVKGFYPIDGMCPQDSIRELGRILPLGAAHVAFIGIGENGHVAFNDPPCRMDTRETLIEVRLDTACRNQQFFEGHFPSFEAVPERALTMPMPFLLSARRLIGTVPTARKADAVKRTMATKNDVNTPASFLHDSNCRLFLDNESAANLG